MELLKYKKEIFELFNITDTGELAAVLMKVVLNHNVSFYNKYKTIASDSERDMLQSLYQYYEADRYKNKQDFTPASICRLVKTLSGEPKTVYDCCGGIGALSIGMLNGANVENVYIEEIDENIIPFLLFNLCLHNANGIVINGDALSGKIKKRFIIKKGNKYSTCIESDTIQDMLFDVAISNPPFNISWEPPTPIELDERFPVIPPKSNANYAFVLNCISKAEKAILILPNGIMSQSNEYEIRQYLIENDLIEAVIILPDKMFEVTSISTCILILNKHKRNKEKVIFIDSRKNCTIQEREQNGQFGGNSHEGRTYKKQFNVLSDEHIKKIMFAIQSGREEAEFSAIKSNDEIAKNDYILVPSRYIQFAEQETKHRDFQEIANNINYISRMRNSCKLIINETIAKNIGLDLDLYKRSKSTAEEMQKQMKIIGINIEKQEDYIKFTKNKNEFVFASNDKEIIPDMLIQFFGVWKSNIALLNTMENYYLSELRDALLPDLMNGVVLTSNDEI